MRDKDLDVTRWMKLYESGGITSGELYNNSFAYCSRRPDRRDPVIERFLEHDEQSVRNIARELDEYFRRLAAQVTDIEEIRKTSPLQPGVEIQVGGGYAGSSESPGWLEGREYYRATFKDFVNRGDGKVPAAFVELEPVGRFAMLKLAHTGDDWEAKGTVLVHFVGAIPADGAAFYKEHPPGTEVESHAEYRLAQPAAAVIASDPGLDDA